MSALPSAAPVDAAVGRIEFAPAPSANPLPWISPPGAEAESLAQLAAQIGDLTAMLKRENDGRLSPAEVALIPEAELQPKAAPVWEGDAKLTFGGVAIDLGIAVFGRKVPAMPAKSDTPPEPAFIEIDAVTISGEGYDFDIYDALSWADLQNVSDAILGEGGK